MAKLTATAARVLAAMQAHYVPRFAADAKIPDLTPAVRGITRANLGASKKAVLNRAKTIVTKAGLAQDAAGPDDVAMRILDMIEKEAPAEVQGEKPAAAAGPAKPKPTEAEADQTRDADPVVTDPNAGAPVAPEGEDPDAVDGDEEGTEAAIMKALGEKLGGDEEMAKAVYDICMGGAQDEVVDPAETETPSTGKAVDGKRAKDEEAPMMKPAMDAAIAAATTRVKQEMRAEARAAGEAREFVRPWVGNLSMAFDTADAVYEQTLKSLGVSTKGVHPSAYRTIISHLQKPGADGGGRKGSKGLAMDSAPSGSKSDLAKRFPHAASIQVL